MVPDLSENRGMVKKDLARVKFNGVCLVKGSCLMHIQIPWPADLVKVYWSLQKAHGRLVLANYHIVKGLVH